MNKLTKTIAKMLCLLTGVTSLAAPLVGCGKDKITALVLATDALDGLFNPFFYTSGPDGEIVGQTQIGMLSSDKDGQLIANWNEPCVALDYSVVKSGNKDMWDGLNDYGGYQTDYYFAIKDNIQFSDGVYLTKDDVLFNIYMYLDPSYTGSNTMYSVKIRGLTQYRTQTPNINSAAGADEKFQSDVEDRFLAIESWIDKEKAPWGDEGFAEYECYTDEKTLESDIRQVQAYFRQGLEETWTSVISTDIEKEYDKYKKADGSLVISEPWQLFLYANGMLTFKEHRGQDGKIDYYEEPEITFTGKIPSKKSDRTGEKFKKQLIDAVYDKQFYGLENADKTVKRQLLDALYSYPVNVYMNDYLLADVKHRAFKDKMQVDNVSGIEIMDKKQASIPYRVDPDNTDSEIKYRTLTDADGNPKSYHVLHITIDGVDPKAIQNFAFTVAPGHYYSDKNVWDKAVNDNDADNKDFGVVFSDPSFMSRVRQKQLPMGAGAYVAATNSGAKAKTKGQFMGSSNLICFIANDKFLLGKPKTQHLRYKVISSSQLYESIKTGDVDYASPSMKRDDINKLVGTDSGKLNYESAENLGYGYIGVSARYIPNIYIRKGIMTVLNSETIIDHYYGNEGASIIVRPMSKTLGKYYVWDDEKDKYYDFDSSGKAAMAWFRKGGCHTDKDGFTMLDEKNNRMKYTFTIAGDSDDHPAALMLQNAADILNGMGLDITVVHDSMALSKLSGGLLTVWAAAWSSSSDPDMYQVYHKNSQATSTTAWGYRYLLSSSYTGLTVNPDNYDQKNMIQKLSDRIDDGRETDDQDARVEIYEDCMNMLMDLAVEFPTYQRKVFYIWRKGVFKENSLIRGDNVTTYQSPLSRIWEVEITKK